MIDAIPHPLVILYGDGVGLACGDDGSISAEEKQGFFAGDTRLLSSYRFTIASHGWRVLARSRAFATRPRCNVQGGWSTD